MAGISFSVFKAKIQLGTKKQTIRAVRKHPIGEGESLYLWWKQRTPERESLGKVICKSVETVWIYEYSLVIANANDDRRSIRAEKDLHNFAIADGFDNWGELVAFFKTTHKLPFKGVLIKW